MISTVTWDNQATLTNLTTISLSRSIAVPSQKVWAVISKPGHLADSHPFCQQNPVEKWPGIGSKDEIYFYSGKIVHRDFYNWIDGEGYDLKLTVQDLDTHQVDVKFRITSSSSTESESILTITLTINALPNRTPWFVRRFIAHLITRPLLQKYLDSVLKGYEYHITTGQPVKRNQFGSHFMFSPAVS
ncbi:MAG TPA: hypothetical protein VK203_30780 [Nostocaceae cyanobacterium]|nr:hypothetical protein [Nostocaceae cyanobacterium]